MPRIDQFIPNLSFRHCDRAIRFRPAFGLGFNDAMPGAAPSPQ
jgi:hypothetical protein